MEINKYDIGNKIAKCRIINSNILFIGKKGEINKRNLKNC